MKAKMIDQKLVLNKKTVANLNGDDMDVVRGGGAVTKKATLCPMTCLTCNVDCL